MVIRVNGITLDAERRAIAFAGREHLFSVGRARSHVWALVVSLLCGGGLSAAELVDFVYGHDPDGGPEYAKSGVQVRICTLGRQLSELGLEIRRFRTGHSSALRYEIVPRNAR